MRISSLVFFLLSLIFSLSEINAQNTHKNYQVIPVSAISKSDATATQRIASKPLKAGITSSSSVPARRNCGTTEYMEEQFRKNPQWKKNLEALDNLPANSRLLQRTQAVITIPVVVHVVYQNSTENISDNQIYSQIAILNEDFRKLNADTNLIPNPFKPLAADAQIEFCLAQQDPNGNPTTGITRTPTTVSSFSQNDDVKATSTGGIDPWNTSDYLNIWVCDLGGGLLGYAQFPGGPSATDGVVIGYKYFGNQGTASAPYDLGRTATHEIGHWLNLRHIWGDANCGNDFVSDTPTSQAANYGCVSFPQVTCNNGPNGDMFMNYMDYGDDNCIQMFTPGQSSRMLAALNGSRSGLLTSVGCVPVNAPPVADFVANNLVILAGGSVSFFDLSTSNPTSWSWTFTGAVTTTSTQQNPSNIVYNTPGVYTVSMTATNGFGTDTETKTGYITVVAPGGPGACDTLNYPLNSNYKLYIYNSTDGFMTGTNNFGDMAKANYFGSWGVATQITGADMFFGYLAGSSATDVIVRVWDATGTGSAPNNILASQTITFNDIAPSLIAGVPTTVLFNNPVAITGPFYLGFEIPSSAGDTLAILSDSVDTTVPGLAWEQWNDATWHPMNDPANQYAAELNLAIFPLVTNSPPSAGFTVLNNTGCIGDTINLNNTSINAQAYIWDLTGGTPASYSGLTPTLTYPAAGTYTISLQAIGSCLATATYVLNNTVTITPNPNVTVTPATTTICPGASTVLTAGGAVSYTWSPATGLTSTTGLSVTSTPLSSTQYTITGTNANGCSNQTSVSVNVVTNLVPTASFSSTGTQGCPGQVFGFTNLSTDAIASVWNFTGGSPSTSTSNNPAITYPNAGSFAVTLIATGCNGNDTLLQTGMITITQPAASVSPTIDSVGTGGSTTLTASGSGSYSWSPSAGLSSTTGATVTASPTATTTYTVTVMDGNGCSDTAQVIVVVDPNIIGVDADANTYGFELYPNPAHESFKAVFSQPLQQPVVTLRNMLGQEVQSYSYQLSQDETTLQIQVTSLPIGFYQLSVVSGGKNYLGRVVIK